MPAPLPSFTPEQFERALAACSPEPLSPQSVRALYLHYQELARWNRTLSLIGPGTAEEVISRHYGEALAALPLLPPGARTAVDIGSGAGFPGIVLAAVRPGLQVTLCEARERKWAFLAAVARRASLPCRCLNVRVDLPLPTGLPEEIDLVPARAVRLPAEVLGALADRLTSGGRILLWVGEDAPDLPRNLLPGRALPLAGSDRRRILGL